MHVSRRGTGRLLLVALAVAAIGVSGAQAGSKLEPNAELAAIHWKHEDALYGASQKASQAQTTAAHLSAAHWKHEDALYRARGDARELLSRLLPGWSSVAAAGIAVFVLTSAIPATGLFGDPFDAPPLQRLGEALARDGVPYRDVFVEYPPLAVPLLALPDVVPGVGYGTAFKVLQALAAVVAICGASAFAHAAGFSRSRALFASVSVGAAPAVLGGLALNRFDLSPAALVIVALALLVRGRTGFSAAVLAVACLVKLTPVVLVPALVAFVHRRHGRRALLRPAAVFTVVGLVVLVPFLVIGQDGLTNSVLYHSERPLHLESTAGGALAVARSSCAEPQTSVEFTYGSANIAGSTAEALAALSTVAGLAGVLLVAWLLHRGPPTAERLVVAASATTAVAMLFGKVLSPQYATWFIPLVPLVAPPLGIAAVALLAALLAVTRTVYARIESVWSLESSGLALLTARNVIVAALAVLLTAGLARRRTG